MVHIFTICSWRYRCLIIFRLIFAFTFFPALSSAQTETTKLLAHDGSTGDNFGWAVSLDSKWAVIGAHHDERNGAISGSSYVFKQEGSWVQKQKLTGNDTDSFDNFGWSVSISGDRLLIGAPGDDERGGESGAVYVFNRDANDNWHQEAKLLPPSGTAGYPATNWIKFGHAVSLSSNLAAIGAPGANSVFIFERTGTEWKQTATLTTDRTNEFLGWSVSVNHNVDTNRWQIITSGWNDKSTGYAYIFEKDPSGKWLEGINLIPTEETTAGRYGISSTISNDYAVVGADLDDEIGKRSGAAYIFRREPNGKWRQIEKLLPTDGTEYGAFGQSISMNEEYIAIGAPGGGANEAYLFAIDTEGKWNEISKFRGADSEYLDRFGAAIFIEKKQSSLDIPLLIIGSFSDDDNGTDSGSAYIFTTEKNVNITNPIDTSSLNPDETLLINWTSSNIGKSETMVVSMKRDAFAHLTQPDGVNWYRFTENALNDGVEVVTIPNGLSNADDWRFYVRHQSSGVYDATDIRFSYESTGIQITSVSPLQASLGQPTEFCFTGSNLRPNMGFHIDDCANKQEVSGDSTERCWSCTPSHTAGKKNGVIKDRDGGNTLFTFLVDVTEPGAKNHPPSLQMFSGLPNCNTTTGKCVKADHQASVMLKATDPDGDLRAILMDWDGDGTVDTEVGVSNNSTTNLSKVFAKSAYLYQSNVTWYRSLQWRAYVVDQADNKSEAIVEHFQLYDLDEYRRLKGEQESAGQSITETEKEIDQTNLSVDSSSNLVSSTGNECFSIKHPELNGAFIPNDKVGIDPQGNAIYCRDGDYTEYRTGDFFGLTGYQVRVEYDFENLSASSQYGECVNYPAVIWGEYRIFDEERSTPHLKVNNYADKEKAKEAINAFMKNEIASNTGDQSVLACREDDVSEVELTEAILNHPLFGSTAKKYQDSFDIDEYSAKKGVVDGVVKAGKEIALSYAGIPGDAASFAGGALSLLGDFVVHPLKTSNDFGAATAEIAQEAIEIGKQIAEIIPELSEAVSHWSPYDRVFYTSYVGTLVAHELIPTSKLEKLLNTANISAPRWVKESYVLVKAKTLTNAHISKKILDDLTDDLRQMVYDVSKSTHFDKHEIFYLLDARLKISKVERSKEIRNRNIENQRKGKEGEAAVRSVHDIGHRERFSIGTPPRVRFTDGSNGQSISEIKNVDEQSFTLQLQDSLSHALASGRKLHLYVRGPNSPYGKETVLTGPLAEEIEENGNIILKFIPGTE